MTRKEPPSMDLFTEVAPAPDLWPLIRAQKCRECGAACKCERDGVIQLSSRCCAHGEADCTPRRIAHVYPFDSGNVMVFDQFNQQMPEYQGLWEEYRDRILLDAPREAVFHLSDSEVEL